MTTSKTTAEVMTEAKRRIESLTVDEVARELATGDIVLVDIREAEELAQHGRIPGSIHLPRSLVDFYADPRSSYHREQLTLETRVILHCAAGGRSALAVHTLKEMGYTSVAHLDGGFAAWKNAGHPVDNVQSGR